MILRKWLDDLMLKAQRNSWEFKNIKKYEKIVDGKLKRILDRVKADEDGQEYLKIYRDRKKVSPIGEQRKKMTD